MLFRSRPMERQLGPLGRPGSAARGRQLPIGRLSIVVDGFQGDRNEEQVGGFGARPVGNQSSDDTEPERQNSTFHTSCCRPLEATLRKGRPVVFNASVSINWALARWQYRVLSRRQFYVQLTRPVRVDAHRASCSASRSSDTPEDMPRQSHRIRRRTDSGNGLADLRHDRPAAVPA